jgi:L-ribulose-5-phosphate 3-epimerase
VNGLRFAYVTNGLSDHRLDDALVMLADLGYDGVAITLDHHHLDPFAPDLTGQVAAVAERLRDLGLGVVVETGARFLLDPRRKHEPTLMSEPGRERRIDLLQRAVAIADDLGAGVVSLWSGVAPAHTDPAVARRRLLDGCSAVLDAAERRDVTLGFEPEPGMLIDSLDGYEALRAALGAPSHFGLTLDVGHCQCSEPQPPAECIARAAPSLVHVQIEDMRRGVHEHLDFGAGEIDFPAALAALRAIDYQGLVCVELPRHSHAAHVVVPHALEFLRQAERVGARA